MITFTVCLLWMGQFTKEQTMKWPSSGTISTAACDSEGALFKVKVSTRLSLMWQATGMNYTLLHAGGNICVCDSTLLWVGHARQIPYWRYSSITMLLYESNRAVQQNKTLILWQCTSWKYLEFWSILCAYCIQDSHLFNDDKQSHILLLHCC